MVKMQLFISESECRTSNLDEEEHIIFETLFDKCEKRDGTVELRDLIPRLEKPLPHRIVHMLIDFFSTCKNDRVTSKPFLFTLRMYEKFIRPDHRYHRNLLGKKVDLEKTYEDQAKFGRASTGMIIMSILQILLFYLGNYDFMVFRHNQKLQIWRYISYMFVHNDINHLLINVICQLSAGVPLEMIHGRRVIFIYYAGVVGGSLWHSYYYPLDDLAGASGGVYAILTSHISKVILNFHEVTNAVPQLLLFGTFTALDTIYNFLMFGNYQKFSFSCHLGGVVCGFLAGLSVLKIMTQAKHKNIIWCVSVTLYSALMIGMVGWQVYTGIGCRRKCWVSYGEFIA